MLVGSGSTDATSLVVRGGGGAFEGGGRGGLVVVGDWGGLLEAFRA